MRNLKFLILIPIIFLLGWAGVGPPEGRIESSQTGGGYTIANGYFHDGDILKRTETVISVTYGWAHEGNGDQATANSYVNYFEIQTWYDRNRNGKADQADRARQGETFLARDHTDAVTTIYVYDTSRFPSSGTLIIDEEHITYTSKTSITFRNCTRGADGSSNVAHTRNEFVGSWNLPLSATLTANIDDAVTTIPGNFSNDWPYTGFILIDTELIFYTGRDNAELTGCERGYGASSAASHTAGTSMDAKAGWRRRRWTCDGSPGDAIGWDAAWPGVEDDLLQNADDDGDSTLVLPSGWYLRRIYVVDASGNTNMESGEVDKMAYYGDDAYMGEDGDASLGVEDDEIVQFRVND